MNRKEKEESKQSNRIENPYEKANLLSKYFYWWMRNFLKIGITRSITENDLYQPISDHQSSKISTKFEKLWNEELLLLQKNNKKPSLTRVLTKVYGFRVLFFGFLFSIIDSTAKILQPLFLGGLISYFTTGQAEITQLNDGYLYAGGIAICSLIPISIFHPFILYIFEVAIKVRLACCSLIYSKILRIKESLIEDGLNGQVINLMSNDVYKFDWALSFLNDLWVGPLQVIIIGWLLYCEAGISSIIGIVFLLSFIPLQAWLGKKSASIRFKIAERTDERVHFMNEIIRGIQVIKMYTWEKSFGNLIEKLRKNEINAIRGYSNIHATLLSFEIITRFSIFLCIISYIYLGNDITARKVFIITSFFNVLNSSMVHYWPLAVTSVAEGYTSLKRVESFLLKLEHKKLQKSNKNKIDVEKLAENDKVTKGNQNNKSKIVTGMITMKNVSAKWNDEEIHSNNELNKINLKFSMGNLYSIIGPVGSGKTTLFQVILGELENHEGEMLIKGKLSFAAQQPWLFEGSVRDNIIFVEEFDQKRYNEVIHCCALERDFKLLPHGDRTIVGERGISLSGGQKCRISLARAIYHKADIYLLDDPLSAVDSHVGNFIFEKCIKEFLKNKTTILITHQIQYLRNENFIIVMENGKIKSKGNYADLSSKQHSHILSQINFVDNEDGGDMDDDESISTSKKQKPKSTTDLTASSPSASSTRSIEIAYKENFEVGSVKKNIYKAYIKSTNSFWMVTFVFVLFLLAQTMKSGGDFFISVWVNWEEEQVTRHENIPENIDEINSWWTREKYIYVYSGIILILLYSTIQRSFSFYHLCLNASKNLHNKIFTGVTSTKMLFFNQNTSGRILNRFSKDIGSIDTALPSVMVDCIIFFLELIGILTVVSILNYWLLIPTVLMFIIFYFLRYVFLSTARNVKRIDAITRSPVLSHTNATLQGLSTIRSMNAEQYLINEFNQHQDLNTTASFLFLATTRGFAFWLDIVCVLYITVVVFSFFSLGNNILGGNVGLAITQVISMIGMCNWGLRQTAELENQMTSVERVVEYKKLTPETQMESHKIFKPKENWPNNGNIKFIDLSMSYLEQIDSDDDFVLKNLNFEIKAKEKIGIVGRTGAGKSSIIQAVFRLANLVGTIVIDEIDITTIGLYDLRSKISIIPQDPVLFSGTLRHNLDPFEHRTDKDLWKALEQVELKSMIQSLAGGLDTKVSDGGSNFSMGQRQLICLARAIIRNNKILVLDEATANVDTETDALIQNTISHNFHNCTVLTIAHRLNTIIECDKILVMDAGTAIEFDHPYNLLQKTNGNFYHLVQQTGMENFNILMELSKMNFHKKEKFN